MGTKPIYDRVIIRVIDPEKVSAGGIVLADSAAEPPNRAKVLAVGTGFKNKDGVYIPLTVKVDDIVMFNPNAGQKTKLNGEEVLIIKEEDIYAIDEE